MKVGLLQRPPFQEWRLFASDIVAKGDFDKSQTSQARRN
jgi:hypothetical protein